MMNTLNTENPIEKPFRKTGDPVDLTSESPLHPRRKSRRIMVGPVPVAGQRLGAELHGAHPLVERQGAVGLGDEIADGLLVGLAAVDDGTDLLALLPDDAFLDGLALGQQIFQFFGADVLTIVEDDDILLASGDVIEAVLVHTGQVSGVEPAVGVEDFRGGLGVLVIASMTQPPRMQISPVSSSLYSAWSSGLPTARMCFSSCS